MCARVLRGLGCWLPCYCLRCCAVHLQLLKLRRCPAGPGSQLSLP